MGLAIAGAHDDPAETVARVSAGRRSRLLRVYRRRLRFEDLEDCYSQATLELVARSRRDPFENESHVEHALELRFKSRIDDRRRAIGGRSPIESAIARAVSVDASVEDGQELEDRAAAVERQVMARTEIARLREVIADLTRDQQLVLGSQVLVDMEASEFCARHGWSSEKYRKVAQRARGKLRVLIDEYEAGERCRQFEADLLAVSAGVAREAATARVRAHVTNCAACARALAELDRSARSVAALLPVPAGIAGGIASRLAGSWSALRRLIGAARHPVIETGASGGAGVAGGSLAGAGVVKVGIVAFCVAGAAGGYAACAHLGVLPSIDLPAVIGAPQHHARTGRHPPRQIGASHTRRSHVAVTVGSADPVRAAVVTATSSAAQTVHPVAVDAPAHHRVRLTAVEQIRREFGRAPAHAASASAPGSAASLDGAAADSEIRREFGRSPAHASSALESRSAASGDGAAADSEIRREFDRPPAHAASASESGSAASGDGAAADSGVAASAPSPAPSAPSVAPSVPAQSASQVGQTQVEFGFEK